MADRTEAVPGVGLDHLAALTARRRTPRRLLRFPAGAHLRERSRTVHCRTVGPPEEERWGSESWQQDGGPTHEESDLVRGRAWMVPIRLRGSAGFGLVLLVAVVLLYFFGPQLLAHSIS